MKNIILLLFLSFYTLLSFSQSETNKVAFDSIIKEANLLYRYEKAAWHGSDIAFSNEKIKSDFGTYVIFHKNDTVFMSVANKALNKQIALYSFSKANAKIPISQNETETILPKKVKTLFNIKQKLLNQLNNNSEAYELSFQEGYNPNPILMTTENGYKMYIIVGTAKPNVIPFGNDYLFIVNKKGKIKSWKKFHKTLIVAQTEMPDGGKIVSAIHSHLKMTPYISATDICTFRLYGYDLYGLQEFKVMSSAMSKIFTYNAKTNSIEESEF